MRLLDHLETPHTLEEIVYMCSGYKEVFDHIDVLGDHVKNLRRICVSNGFWSKYRLWYYGKGKICEGGEVKDGTPLGINEKIVNANVAGRMERAAVLDKKRKEFETYIKCFIQDPAGVNLLNADCDYEVERLCEISNEIRRRKENNRRNRLMNQQINADRQAQSFFQGDQEMVDEQQGVISLDTLFMERDQVQKDIKRIRKDIATAWARKRLEPRVPITQDVYEDMKRRNYWVHTVKASDTVWRIEKHNLMQKEKQQVPEIFYRVYRLESALDDIKQRYVDGIQQKTRQIMDKLIALVRCGKVRVAMRYNDGKNQDASFLFCKRRISNPIHRMVCSRNRGDLLVREGRPYIVNQRRKNTKKYTLDIKSVNAAFFSGKTKRIIHHFEINVDLRALIPYYAVQIKRDEFKPKRLWNSTLQHYETSPDLDSIVVDDFPAPTNGQTYWKKLRTQLMGTYGDAYYAYFTY